MNEACQYLLGTHDFSCFEKPAPTTKPPSAPSYEAFWKPYIPSHLQVRGGGNQGGGGGPSALRGLSPSYGFSGGGAHRS